MIVLKLGGTSLQGPAAMERLAEIVRERLERRPLLVISAVGKTTRALLEAARRAGAGSRDDSVAVVDELRSAHRELIERIAPDDPDDTARFLSDTFDELVRLLDGMSIVGEVPPRALDRILSYGELLSSRLLSDALASRGLPARLLDARELVVTDDRHGSATPRWEPTRRRLRASVPAVLDAGEVPVLQGYIAAAPDGATTTLGFEGSDYTATLAGAALEAEEIEIWKDVPGLMTADPVVVPGARTVPACSYAEAGDLARFGAKILHPRAIEPAARSGVPIRIRDSREPEETGTRIASGDPEDRRAGILSITFMRPVTALRLPGSPGQRDGDEAPGIDRLRLLADALLRKEPDLLLATVSGDELLVVAEPDGRALVESIHRLAPGAVDVGASDCRDRGLITLVGGGIDGPEAVSRSIEVLADSPPDLIVSGASPRTVHLLVDADAVEPAVRRLHQALFD